MCRTYADNGDLSKPQPAGAYLRMCSRTPYKGRHIRIVNIPLYPAKYAYPCQPAILRERFGAHDRLRKAIESGDTADDRRA